MKIVIRIILGLCTLLMVGLLILTLVFAYNKANNQITYLGNYTAFFSTGTSMHPVIKDGDLLIVKRSDEYKLNEIIAYLNKQNQIVTHRIVEINDGYYTKGDSNNFIDTQKVLDDAIYGKVIEVLPGIGVLLVWVIQNGGLLYVGFTSFVVFLMLTGRFVYYVRRCRNWVSS